MAQIFHPSFNTISKLTIFGAIFFVAATGWAWDQLMRSQYVTHEGVARAQPVPFSHKHHVAGLGIDCRYCHTSVEDSAFAGIPSTKVCMTCHSVVWKDTPMLEPVRQSYRDDRPIEWARVHDLPDFAYFNHSIHLTKGIGCSTCHGRVDQMPLMWRTNTLHMDWCLSCHKNPVPFVRPRAEVFNLAFDVDGQTMEERIRLAHEYQLQAMTDCSTCHR